MDLSSLVHAGMHQTEQQQYIAYAPRPQQIMVSSLMANQYAGDERPHASYTYVTAPQPPPSPPVDETSKCSLPSISSLLGDLPNDSNSQEDAQPQASWQQAPQSQNVEYRPSSSGQCNASPLSTSRSALPLTPPMHSDTGFDRQRSLSTASNSGYSIVSAPAGYSNGSVSSMNSVESLGYRQTVPASMRRVSMPAGQGAYHQSSVNGSDHSAPSMGSYYTNPMQPPTPSTQVSGLYHQRPMPQQFRPETIVTSSNANPWQHHHYISPSSVAAFPQSQDRYICQSCNKAFSRPSSLRIHSHSHTGEKPFKCPQHGCGKAFSVRSNMKRHERGCHT